MDDPADRYPVLLGGGTPFFAVDGTRRRLTLLGNEEVETGAAIRLYRFARRLHEDHPRQ